MSDASDEVIRVLIVDDHKVVQRGLLGFLKTETDIEVVGDAQDGSQALQILSELDADGRRPDVVLMDLQMPVMDGVQATREIRSRYDDVEVVVLTSFVEEERVHAALEAGASGYLLKDADVDEVSNAIRSAHQGEVHLDATVARRLMASLRAPKQDPLGVLTEREREILRMVAAGKPNKQIAAELVISERTARTHVSNILRKLDLASRTQAALWAVREGLARPRHNRLKAPLSATYDVGRPAPDVSRRSSPLPESRHLLLGKHSVDRSNRSRPRQRRGTLPPIQRSVNNDMRRKNRRDFVSVLVSSALMITVVVVIWAVTGAGSFWPIWVIFGLSIVVLASAWRALGPQHSGKHRDSDR